MIAAAGFLAQETVSQQPWLDAWTGPVATLAVAGRKVPKPTKAEKDAFCYNLPGNIAPAGNFDPLNLLDGVSASEVLRRREAELTHGRVSMLASLGFLVQESYHPLFRLGDKDIGPAIRHLDEVRAEVPIFFEILVL